MTSRSWRRGRPDHAHSPLWAGLLATLALVAALVAGLVAPAPAQAAPIVDEDRLSGPDRYATAAEVALAGYPDGASTVLLASGQNFPDALAAAGRAGLIDAPVLLTARDTLPPATADAIATLGADTVTVLGGTAAVSQAVEQALDVPTVQRVRGRDRYATAALISDPLEGRVGEVGGRRTALIATGRNFPDALALGPLAFRLNLPVLLTQNDRLPDETVTALRDLDIGRVVIAGGNAAVSRDVEARLEQLVGAPAIRLAGVNRNETATAIADFATRFLEFPGRTTLLANNAGFADAIAAGPYAGAEGAPVLLTAAQRLPDAVTGYLLLNDGVIERVVAVGGERAVAEPVLTEAVTTAVSDPQAEIFTVDLSAANVVRGGTFFSGQPEGVGTAIMKASPGKGTIAFLLDAAVTPPFTGAPGAHIHRGAIDAEGPIVAPLATDEELQRTGGGLSGYVREDAFADRSVSVADILADPDGFYVNVHTRAYPAGAVRGQLPEGGQVEVAERVGPLTFTLDAAHVVTVDPDDATVEYGTSSETGTAEVTLTFDLTTGTVAYRLDVSGIAGDLSGGTGAALREGFIDQNGPVVVPLASAGQLAGAADGVVEGSFDTDDFTDGFPDLSVREIFTAAGDFHVTVSTAQEDVAVRGQLPDGGRVPSG